MDEFFETVVPRSFGGGGGGVDVLALRIDAAVEPLLL